MKEELDSDIWFPHFWFFLYSVAHCYPEHPNTFVKRKYYDFISNLPLFCPNEEERKRFIRLLDEFPITPYLDNKDSFTYWLHFIHNKIHFETGKLENTYLEHLDQYYKEYDVKSFSLSERYGIQKKYIVVAILALCTCFILYYT